VPLIPLVALFFLGMGLVGIVTPARVLGMFGVAVETPAGRTEVRAVYGGFGIAVAAVLLVAMVADDIRDGVLVAVAASLAGMAGGRIASAALGERLGLWPTWFWFAVELILAGILLAALAI
jgi:hypothetical protein